VCVDISDTTSRAHLFAYGTLELPLVLERVTERSFKSRAAVLPGYARYLLQSHPYPAVVCDPAASVPGTLYLDLDPEAFARLDAYEGRMYERVALGVLADGEPAALVAQCYVLRAEFRERLSRRAWDKEEFERQHLAGYLARI
jgi:gamma-glutamylcyclotransferase (GGCT)/AIG2-like uncharacterized protein YtfP